MNSASQKHFGKELSCRVQQFDKRFWGTLGGEHKGVGADYTYFGIGDWPLVLAATLLLHGDHFFTTIFEMEKRDRNPDESECVSCGWEDIKFKDVFASNKYGGFHEVCCHSLLFCSLPAGKQNSPWKKGEAQSREVRNTECI